MKTETVCVRQFIPGAAYAYSEGSTPVAISQALPLTPPDDREWRFRELKLLTPTQMQSVGYMSTAMTEFECLVIWEMFEEEKDDV